MIRTVSPSASVHAHHEALRSNQGRDFGPMKSNWNFSLSSQTIVNRSIKPAARLSIVADRCSSRRSARLSASTTLEDMAAGIRRDKTALRIDEQGSSPTNRAEN